MSIAASVLITRLRERADQESTLRVTDTMALAWLNEAQGDLWDEIILINPSWGETTHDDTLTGGTLAASKITVQSDFLSLLRVERDPDTVGRRFLPQYEPLTGPMGLGYRLYASTIEIGPYESAAGTYRTHYVRQPLTLSATSTTIEPLLEQFYEALVLSACIVAHIRDEEGTAEDKALLTSTMDRVKRRAAKRSQGAPPVVPDPAGYARWQDPNLLRLP